LKRTIFFFFAIQVSIEEDELKESARESKNGTENDLN
jgi:hypothetical protein